MDLGDLYPDLLLDPLVLCLYVGCRLLGLYVLGAEVIAGSSVPAAVIIIVVSLSLAVTVLEIPVTAVTLFLVGTDGPGRLRLRFVPGAVIVIAGMRRSLTGSSLISGTVTVAVTVIVPVPAVLSGFSSKSILAVFCHLFLRLYG